MFTRDASIWLGGIVTVEIDSEEVGDTRDVAAAYTAESIASASDTSDAYSYGIMQSVAYYKILCV